MARPDRDNDFDAIQLLAALAVLVGHAWPLTGISERPLVGGLKLFDLGVYVFFSLSGYLIATSWARSPRVVPFLLRRVFRILPALVVVVLVTTFVLGPLVSTLGAAGYFGDPGSWAYLRNVTLLPVYTLPGVFLENPIDGTVNGSLWTLGPEFLCYLGVLGFGLLALARSAPGIRLAGPGLVGIASAVVLLVPDAAPRGMRDVLTVLVFFAGGAVISEAERRGLAAPLRSRWLPPIVAFGWLIGGAFLAEREAVALAWVVLPFLIIAFGSRSTPVLRRAGRFGDLSYGLYLWGFPVQQTVVLVAPGLPLAVDILLVAVITGVLALGSWWLVERRAISLGRRLGERFRMKRSEVATG
jgi:peptidoglycan/LPS O-acetylase OafA/YrhL